ncbi:retrotransposon protein, putative, ty1-copia subclass [Tanacetum coccineum]
MSKFPQFNDKLNPNKIEAHQKHYDEVKTKWSCISIFQRALNCKRLLNSTRAYEMTQQLKDMVPAKASKERLDQLIMIDCWSRMQRKERLLFQLERKCPQKEKSDLNTNTQQEVVTPIEPDDISLPIRKTSSRVSKPSQFYYGFHIEEDKISDSTLSELDEPANYKETMLRLMIMKYGRWMSIPLSVNRKLTEAVFRAQPKGFENAKYPKRVYKIQKAIYGLKQASRSWNLCFHRKSHRDAAYTLGIKIYIDRSKRLIRLSQDTYLDKNLKRFKMENSKKGNLPLHHDIKISKDLCPKTNEELDKMSRNPGEGYWTVVKNILKYLRNTKDRFLVYGGEEELRVTGYCDASWQIDKDDSRLQSGWVFLLIGRAMTWKSSKQDTVADSTCESEYIAACEASKEAIWIER